MKPAPAGNLLASLAAIPDPRGRQGRRHPFEALRASMVCAWWQGARGYAALAPWIHDQEVEFWQLLGFPRTPPTPGAFGNLLRVLSPEHRERAVQAGVEACLGAVAQPAPLAPVARDGKTLRGTLGAHPQAVPLLSLLDQHTGCVLSQTRVDAKTNEAKAALGLLRSLVLAGRVITGDARFCQREICQPVVDEGGPYFCAVPDHQPTRKAALAAEFQAAFSPGDRTGAASPSGRGRNSRPRTWPRGATTTANQHATGG